MKTFNVKLFWGYSISNCGDKVVVSCWLCSYVFSRISCTNPNSCISCKFTSYEFETLKLSSNVGTGNTNSNIIYLIFTIL